MSQEGLRLVGARWAGGISKGRDFEAWWPWLISPCGGRKSPWPNGEMKSGCKMVCQVMFVDHYLLLYVHPRPGYLNRMGGLRPLKK